MVGTRLHVTTRPAKFQHGTLRAGTLAGRRRFSFLVLHGPLTSVEYNKRDSSTLAVSDVDPAHALAASNRCSHVFAAFQHVCLLDLAGHIHSEGRIICRASRHPIRRANSFQKPILPFLLLGNFFILYSRFPR
jgi:hypothetical protein